MRGKKWFNRFRHACRTRYESLRLISGLLYFVGLPVGMFLLLKLIQFVIISIDSGPRSYLIGGVRYDDYHGFHLSNGHEIPVLLHALGILLFFVLMPTWMVVSLFLVTLCSKPRRDRLRHS
jgi:hypothetical protein